MYCVGPENPPVLPLKIDNFNYVLICWVVRHECMPKSALACPCENVKYKFSQFLHWWPRRDSYMQPSEKYILEYSPGPSKQFLPTWFVHAAFWEVHTRIFARSKQAISASSIQNSANLCWKFLTSELCWIISRQSKNKNLKFEDFISKFTDYITLHTMIQRWSWKKGAKIASRGPAAKRRWWAWKKEVPSFLILTFTRSFSSYI